MSIIGENNNELFKDETIGFQDEAIKTAKGYHFDNNQWDHRYDTATVLGRFEGDWKDEVADLVAKSKPLTFHTRGDEDYVEYNPPRPFTTKKQGPFKDAESDWFKRVGFGEGYYNYDIINKTNPQASSTVQKMVDRFCFETPIASTVHVQLTGQCFPWHVDIFQHRYNFKKADHSRLIRIHVMLTDWQPGHWFGYGNYTYTGWKAGDFHTFNVDNVPHYTANASYHPRVSLMVTGVRTEATDKFLWEAIQNKTVKL